MSSDQAKNRVQLNLKKDIVQGFTLTAEQVQPGMRFTAYVKSVAKFGVFVKLKDSSVDALCHISECVDNQRIKPDQLKELYQVGDKVKVLVLKVEGTKITVSMKASHFTLDEPSSHDSDEETESDQQDHQSTTEESDIEIEDESEEQTPKIIVDQPKHLSKKIDIATTPTPPTKAANKGPSPFASTSMFSLDWGQSKKDDSDEESSEESEMSLEQETAEPQRGQKLKKKKEIEKEVSKAEKMELEAPTTIHDFERMILQTPNSSLVWVQFMAFWVSSMQIEKAREIAGKALKRIDPNMREERLNIWEALLNLEYKYGDEDTQAQTLQNALTYNDKKLVYLIVIKIHTQANNHKLADEMFNVLTKKFKTNKSVWIKYNIYLLKQDRGADSAQLLKRALQALPQRKHIETISKFAQLEYQIGNPMKGRTMFEELLSTYPKKIDLWTVYIDQEFKATNIDQVRSLYNRASSLNLSTKKMKHLFKRFLEFEQNHGDAKSVQEVKQKAIAYVESKA